MQVQKRLQARVHEGWGPTGGDSNVVGGGFIILSGPKLLPLFCEEWRHFL